MGRFFTYVLFGAILMATVIAVRGWPVTESRTDVPQGPSYEQTVDRSAAGRALDELVGEEAPPRDIPRRPAPRGDTYIVEASGG